MWSSILKLFGVGRSDEPGGPRRTRIRPARTDFTREQYLEAIRSEEVAPYLSRYLAQLEQMCANSVLIECSEAADEEIAVGASKFGGMPDMPAGTDWPESEGRPLPFVAQIRLSEASVHDVDGLLPKSGLLLFFANWDGHRVLRFDEDAELVRASAPPELSPVRTRRAPRSIYEACSLTFRSADSFPSPDSHELDRLHMNGDAEEAYVEQVLEPYLADVESHPTHRMLGYADTVQNEMRPKADYADWVLLLQVDTDDAPKMMWGDAGRIYFWMRRSELEAGDFGSVVAEEQCG